MKQFKRITSLLIAALMMFSLASCSLVDDNDTDITNENIKIGVLLRGTKDEADVADKACLNAINELTECGYGIKGERFKYQENIDPSNPDSVSSALKTLINFECNLIIAPEAAYEDDVIKVADDKENQDVKFMVFNGENHGSNVYGYKANITGAAYLSGIAAGMKANELKVPQIGFLAASEKDLTTLNAFAAGVQSAAKQVKVTATFGTDAANAQKLITAGCVVLASDFESDEIAKAADEGKVFFCGFGTDSYEEYESSFLCAPIYTFTQFYINAVKAIVDDTDVPDFSGGYAAGVTSLTDLDEKTIAAGTADAVTAAAEQLMLGKLSFEISASVPAANVEIAK